MDKFLRAPQDLWANRVRLAELREKAVKVQPLPIGGVASCTPDDGRVGTTSRGIDVRYMRHADRDLLDISVAGCDGLECRGDPLGALLSSAQKRYIFEFCRCREVYRRVDWEQD